jgi:Predicted phosphoesterase or phosphohydrolase
MASATASILAVSASGDQAEDRKDHLRRTPRQTMGPGGAHQRETTMIGQASRGQRTFFTSDTHFGHAGIIRQCARPFDSVEEMDEAMIQQWNSVVRRGDRVIHLGDFAYKSKNAAEIFRRLNGERHLIRGNHDKRSVTEFGWASVSDLADITLDGKRIILCHYAIRSWPGFHRGALHFFGHSHGNLPGSARCIDVGVDSVGFRPLELDEILPLMANKPDLIFAQGQPYVDFEETEEADAAPPAFSP